MAQELPPPARRRGRPKAGTEPDWNAIRTAYELGSVEVSELAKQFGVNRSAIDRRIEREGWVGAQALRQVRAQTAAELIRMPGTTVVTSDDIRSAARENADVIRKHRRLIERARTTVETLQDQLKLVVEKRHVLERAAKEGDIPRDLAKIVQAAVSVGNNASIAKELANAMKVLVELERRAFGISDESEDGDDAKKRMPTGEIDRANAAETYRRMLG